jgi:hypothetical protein
MTKLQQLYDRCGQSPWLDNLTHTLPPTSRRSP